MRLSGRPLALLAALLLAGCGLPLPRGVQTPGQVPEEQQRPVDITVLPPGPAPGASARDVVVGFLAAQGSLYGRHAVARQFLTPEANREWDDASRVEVYDPATAPMVEQTADPEVVTVTSRRAAVVDGDGAYRRVSGQSTDVYRVRCTDGSCRIAALDDGLRLDPDELVRSFAPRPVHFLAPRYGPGAAPGHLVADLVWLPRLDAAQSLVQAVLDGPSAALAGSVTTAVPAGTRLLRPVAASADGTVTVDLSAQARALDDPGRERLSAQLVWTLRALRTGFRRLRLLVEGVPLSVAGSAAAQPAGAWPGYDPERLRPGVSALYVEARQLRGLGEGGLPSSAATSGQLPVDAGALSPGGVLGLLSTRPDGRTDVHVGPPTGPFEGPRATGRLSSPTWGSGEQGLFLLRSGSVVLLPPEGGLVDVPVEGPARPLRRIQVARDGVRVALLVGAGDRSSLFVGRFVQEAGGTRIRGLREIVPRLTGVVDVDWESGTSLVVLAAYPFGRLPGRVAVDGSSAPLLSSRLPQGLTPVSLAAAAGRPVVLSGTMAGEPRLYRDTGQVFAQQARGRAPFYPG